MKNIEFITQKINNFAKFLRTAILIKCKKDIANYSAKLDELENVDKNQFTQYIIVEIVPYKNNINAFVEKLLADAQLSLSDLTADELTKIRLYIECFIDYVQQ